MRNDVATILARYQPRQPSLLDGDGERVERPRKNVHKLSKQVYSALRDGDYLPKSSATVLRCLGAYRNRYQAWPTCSELTACMFAQHDIPRDDVRRATPKGRM